MTSNQESTYMYIICFWIISESDLCSVFDTDCIHGSAFDVLIINILDVDIHRAHIVIS